MWKIPRILSNFRDLFFFLTADTIKEICGRKVLVFKPSQPVSAGHFLAVKLSLICHHSSTFRLSGLLWIASVNSQSHFRDESRSFSKFSILRISSTVSFSTLFSTLCDYFVNSFLLLPKAPFFSLSV